MWSIVAFKDDSLEVVPSNWFNNELCAWPKKYLRSCIDNEVSPNENYFSFLSARKLGKVLIMTFFLNFQQFDLIILFFF